VAVISTSSVCSKVAIVDIGEMDDWQSTFGRQSQSKRLKFDICEFTSQYYSK